jgi:lysine 2,3-aminomutase
MLVDAGIPMLAQSVLLKGVNDDAAVLADLMRTFVENRIKPYYLHHPDLAPGTAHFRLTLAEGRALVESLRGHVSGLCQPDYILDIPGGHGKVRADSRQRAFARVFSSLCGGAAGFRGIPRFGDLTTLSSKCPL